MATPFMEVENLVFDYPGYRALAGVSLQLQAATVTALVGPNGAGKTTLMRCMAALETPLSGQIRLLGQDIHEHPREAHRQMGHLSDHFGLYGDLSVAQGLTFAARAQGLPADRVADAVASTLERMGLAPQRHALARTLSRGQRQRLAIGQAIIHNPRLLLLDEPASGLDPEARAALADVMVDLRNRGMTLVVSSHILAELEVYATHMLALSAGRVLDHRPLGSAWPSGHQPPAGNPANPSPTHASNGAATDAHPPTEAPPSAPVRTLRLSLAAPSPGWLDWLAAQPGVSVRASAPAQPGAGPWAEVGFAGTAADQAALVAACVQAGHPLAALAEQTESLQQSYLRTLAADRARRAQPQEPTA